jgi:predicted AAA+ superfamily ATPase
MKRFPMDELQQTLMMAREFFPQATMEEVKPIYLKIKETDPNITVDQIRELMKEMIPKIEKQMSRQANMNPEETNAKMDALKSMRK